MLPEPVKNNLFLTAPPGQRPRYWNRKQWARKLLSDLDLDMELFPDAPSGALTLADRQLFEVAKALASEPKVLLLDEPTTALGPHEVEALHRADRPRAATAASVSSTSATGCRRYWRSRTASRSCGTGAARGPSMPPPPRRHSSSS